jgi:photosystem II stability/assembly factor-like uncharacterized protein
MKPKLLLCILVSLFFISCKKTGSTNAPAATDTLSVGWSRISSPLFGDYEFEDIFFINNVGFVTGGETFKSIDGGDTWVKKSTLNHGHNIGMDQSGNVVIVYNDSILISHDQGNTFTSQNNLGYLFDIFFAANSKVYSPSSNNFITSSDAGETWQVNFPGFTFGSPGTLHFIDQFTGWVGGIENPSNRNSFLYKTTDGGLTWARQNPGNVSLKSIYALDNLTCYVAGDSGVAKTTDGGNTWQKVYNKPPLVSTWADIHFLSADIGYLSYGNNIFKTIDGGTSWNKVVTINSITNFQFIEIHFTDVNHGWACGTNGVILKFVQ